MAQPAFKASRATCKHAARMPVKALRGAGFGPQPAGARSPPRAGFLYLFRGGAGCGLRAGFFYLLRCGPGCGPGYVKICGAGRAAGRMIQFRGGCGLNFFSRRSFSQNLCVCVCVRVCARVRVCAYVRMCVWCVYIVHCVACTTACVRRIFALIICHCFVVLPCQL